MDNLQPVSYLLRKTNLTLDDIRSFEPEQFTEIVNEVEFQESEDRYERASFVASLLAAIANTVQRKSNKVYKSKDFLNLDPPKRETVGTIEQDAKAELALKFGIKLPTKEIRDI